MAFYAFGAPKLELLFFVKLCGIYSNPVCAACEPWKSSAQVEGCPEQVLWMCFGDDVAVAPDVFLGWYLC